MTKYEVPIVYIGQCNYLVEASSPDEAREIAISMFNEGERPDILEWERIERVGEVKEATVYPVVAWTEAAIAWAVCASIHREYGKGRDALYTIRQADFEKHAEDARFKAIGKQRK